MQCDLCRNEAALFQPSSGRYLCGRHLVPDIEARAKRSIRSHHWMKTGDHIAVVIAGDKKSAALARFLQKLVSGRRDIRLSAVPSGDAGAGRRSLTAATRAAESLGITCIDMPLPGRTPGPDGDRVTRLALAITLDDIAQEVLVQFLSGNAEQLIHPLPAGSRIVPVICPFIAVPSVEADYYWDHEGTGTVLLPSSPGGGPVFRDVEALFRDYHRRHPATGHALLNLAEELSGCRVAEIAAAIFERDGFLPCSFMTEVSGNGA
jgi:tRNA(Ile)-lysidine synthase TilS/MesJ